MMLICWPGAAVGEMIVDCRLVKPPMRKVEGDQLYVYCPDEGFVEKVAEAAILVPGQTVLVPPGESVKLVETLCTLKVEL